MYIVAQDGTGDYASIQAAIDALAASGGSDRTVLVRPGVYRERVVVHPSDIRIVGEDAERTVVTHDACAKDRDENGQEKGTFLSFTVIVTGSNVTLENLTVRNDAGDGSAVGQAVALYAAGDRGRFLRCRLIAHQDTLFCGPMMPKVEKESLPYASRAECVEFVGDCPLTRSRAYFEDCFIQGDIDFIFGPYRCWFEGCALFMNALGGWYTAANTPREQPYGLIFHRCRLTGACAAGGAYLGRPWRQYARTLFLDCEMDECVSPQGFADWNELKPVTDRCGEWRTSGARADLSARHIRQKRLTDAEARAVTLPGVLSGEDGWKPWEKE